MFCNIQRTTMKIWRTHRSDHIFMMAIILKLSRKKKKQSLCGKHETNPPFKWIFRVEFLLIRFCWTIFMILQLPNVWTGRCIVTCSAHIVQQHSKACQTKASRPNEQIESGKEDKIANTTNGIANEGKRTARFDSIVWFFHISISFYLQSNWICLWFSYWMRVAWRKNVKAFQR